MTEAHRPAAQLQPRESVQLKRNPKFFTACSISSPPEPCGTSEDSVSQSRDEAAEQHSALVPLLRYLLYSHTPGRRAREAVRDVTHIHLQQREREGERVEQQSGRQRRHLQLHI